MAHAAPSVAVPLPAHAAEPVAAPDPLSPRAGSRPVSPSPGPSPPATSSPSSLASPAGPSPSAPSRAPSPTPLDGPLFPATTSLAPPSPATTCRRLLPRCPRPRHPHHLWLRMWSPDLTRAIGVASLAPRSALMGLLLGLPRVCLKQLRVLLLSLVATLQQCRFLIGAKLWTSSIRLFSKIKHGP
jgi:hypothetical protein